MNLDQQKKLAAERAVEKVKSGMIVGLGTGSTVQFALEKISEKLKQGKLRNIYGVPSSLKTENEAKRLEIPLITLDEALKRCETGKVRREIEEAGHFQLSIRNSQLPIDLTIDGADEVAVGKSELVEDEDTTTIALIKGGGGALLREKILAQASKRLIIIIDETKLSGHPGEKWHVPVEVIKIALNLEKKFLESLDAKVSVRKTADGSNYITDENNFILDADFGKIKNVRELSALLNERAGIVEHGLFIGITDKVICAMKNGTIKELE